MIPFGDTGFALCVWHELGRMDRNQALTLLRRSQSDIWAQASLHSVVDKRFVPTTMTRMSDEQVLEGVADLIASGELVLARTGDHAVARKGDTVLGKTAKSAAPPPVARRALLLTLRRRRRPGRPRATSPAKMAMVSGTTLQRIYQTLWPEGLPAIRKCSRLPTARWTSVFTAPWTPCSRIDAAFTARSGAGAVRICLGNC